MTTRGAEGVLITGVYGSGKSSLAAEGAGTEDVTIGNDRPIGTVAHEVMAFLGWL